MYLIADIVKMI